MKTILALVTVLIAVPSGAQDKPTAVFRSGIDIVALSVVVTDAEGKFVPGLSSGDFAVFEEGVQQDVSFFAAMPAPIDLALLLDTSASMSDKITTVQQAAIGFTDVVRPGDRLTVVDVKDTVKVLHPLNEDVAAARAAITSTFARGNTSLYNALYMTLKELVKQRGAGEIRRQAIVVLTDGDDTTSLVGFDDVMDLAKQSGVAMYTITLRSASLPRHTIVGDPSKHAASEFAMKELAEETGARSFFPAQILELAGVYRVIANELASQYSLGYTSKNPAQDGSYRRVAVRVERPGLRARTRAGYAQPAAIASR